MSLLLAKSEILRFLASDRPEVLCIRGEWGVGKTYAWNTYLAEAMSADGIKLPTYAYVSLFGINSLDQLKYAIFENTVRSNAVGVEPSLTTLTENTAAVVNNVGRKSLKLLQSVPYLGTKDVAGGALGMAFLTVKNRVVCLDDLDRKGANLRMVDVMGLMSQLKEQKHCKVVLILNEEKLGNEREDFTRHFEKVVDTSIHFKPSPKESAEIAVRGDQPTQKTLRESFVALGVSNIRIIKRAERLVEIVSPLLAPFDWQVTDQAIRTIALLTWSLYGGGPAIEFLKSKRAKSIFGVLKKDELSEDERRWDASLDRLIFTNLDEFDTVLLDGIGNGYFDAKAIEDQAKSLDVAFKAQAKDATFKAAWSVFHDSFDLNEDELVTAITNAFMESHAHITPLNVNATVELLKALGHEQTAREMIPTYIESRGSNRKAFDLERSSLGGAVTDPDLRAAFEERFASLREERDPVEVLLEIEQKASWSQEDMALLSGLSVDCYYEIFKKEKGDRLAGVVRTSLDFGRISNADDRMKAIVERASEALRRVAEESPLNARRVSKWIKLPQAG